MVVSRKSEGSLVQSTILGEIGCRPLVLSPSAASGHEVAREPPLTRILTKPRLAAASLLALLLAPALFAQSREEWVQYRIEFPNRAHREALVTARFGALGSEPLELRMSRSSPGRYRLHDFARNVYELVARDAAGRVIGVTRPDPYGWTVAEHEGLVEVTYRVYGDLLNGTYLSVDESHAMLNMPATFVWARGLEERPIELTVVPAEGDWEVATQLRGTSNPFVFRAPDLQYFLDSPTEVGPVAWRRWKAGEGEVEQTIRLAMHHLGTDEEVDAYADLIQRSMTAAIDVFGELPRFDFGTYTFIANYLPYASGGAMEHRNSTPLMGPEPLATHAVHHLHTLVHEFFHSWNVERIRPASLEPFDFDDQNMSGELWFAEGFTNYYDGLLLRRAAIWSEEEYLRDLSLVVDRIVNSPATRYGSPVEMSQAAVFNDRGVWIDPRPIHNTYLHYYSYGDAIGLALDLALRSRFDSDLDDLMRQMWRSHGRDEVPYRNSDVEAALAKVSTPEFAGEFFAEHVYGREVPDYEALLEPAGLVLRPAYPALAWIGDVALERTPEGDGLRVAGGTLEGSPLYRAGVDRGDRLLRLDGKRLDRPAELRRALARHAPGDVVPLRVSTRVGIREVEITLEENPHVEIVTREQNWMESTQRQRAFRQRWIGSASPEGELSAGDD